MIHTPTYDRRHFLGRAAGALSAFVITHEASARDVKRMPDLKGDSGWLNSAPLSNKALLGKVALVNFWTYSCINSLRELPYMKSWSAKYKDVGFVVLGVHSPEFAFERDPVNVRHAVSALNVTYPVVVDSRHSIWRAFRNEYWPADYVLDASGRIRYHHFGEGDYAGTERVIQRLLKGNGATRLDERPVRITADGAEAPPSSDVRSAETYVGYARAENFASLDAMVPDSRITYRTPKQLALNEWGLAGGWNIGAESASLESASGKVLFRFHSRDLHMVLGPTRRGVPVRFQVRLNGEPPRDDRGVDTAADGTGEIVEPRMYQLIRQKGVSREATFEIEFLDHGAEAFSFTFG